MDVIEQVMEKQNLSREKAEEYVKLIRGIKEQTEEKKEKEEKSERFDMNKLEKRFEKLEELLDESKKSKDKARYENVDDNEVNRIKTDVWFMSKIMNKSPKSMNAEAIKSGYRTHKSEKVDVKTIQKALDTTDQSSIVPTELQSSLIEDVEKASVILSNLRVINLPSNPYEMPYRSASMTAYGVGEATDDSASSTGASDVTTDNITFNAKKLGARTLWSRELEEDAAIAILPMIRDDFMRIMTDSWERVFIFGDESTTSNINTHDDDTEVDTTAGAKSFWLQADGLVHHCIVSNTGQANDASAALSASEFLDTRQLLGKYGDNPDDVMYIIDRVNMYDAMALDELETVEKFGNRATILTGQIGAIYGSPVLVSDGLPETDDNGKISATPGNNDNSAILAINRRVPLVGRRGQMRMDTEKVIDTDQMKGVIYSRYDIQIPFTEGVAYTYNLT